MKTCENYFTRSSAIYYRYWRPGSRQGYWEFVFMMVSNKERGKYSWLHSIQSCRLALLVLAKTAGLTQWNVILHFKNLMHGHFIMPQVYCVLQRYLAAILATISHNSMSKQYVATISRNDISPLYHTTISRNDISQLYFATISRNYISQRYLAIISRMGIPQRHITTISCNAIWQWYLETISHNDILQWYLETISRNGDTRQRGGRHPYHIYSCMQVLPCVCI